MAPAGVEEILLFKEEAWAETSEGWFCERAGVRCRGISAV